MTKLAVSIMVRSLEQAVTDAVRAAELGADLVEFRLDLLGEDAADQTAPLIQRCPLPCILTCRPTWEGGHYAGAEAARIELIERIGAAATTPAYLDVELAAYQKSSAMRQAVARVVDHPGQVLPTSMGLILSAHDFQQRPADLYQRIEAMAAAPACRVIKLAWKARSLRDNLEAFEIISQHHKPTIALCMGEFGLPSRVLAGKFGALLTFATLNEDSATAPGQPTIEQLKKLYRWDAIDARTKVFGVIGWPVGHSMSPAIHNAGFDKVGYNGVYLPLAIPPEYEHFKATMCAWLDMGALDFRGASVTIPHKQNLLRFVREFDGEIEPLADQIGAANTLHVRDDGALYACNTDYAAALDAVCDGLGVGRDELAGMRIAVVGAGGAARAVVAGFAQHGATVVIYNRTFDKARNLAQSFDAAPGKVVAARMEKLCDSCCQVFINCTPVGMSPHTDATPMPTMTSHGKGWGPGTAVFDTVYNPVYTRLLREARAAGCVTITGAEMFVRQAAAQFKLWTGLDAPLDLFRKTMMSRLG